MVGLKNSDIVVNASQRNVGLTLKLKAFSALSFAISSRLKIILRLVLNLV